MTLHDVFGFLAALLAGACWRDRTKRNGGNTMTGKKSAPFDLGAAYAAKLSANDGQVTFALGGAEFSMPSAAKWTEEQMRATSSQTPFEVMREALGVEQYEALEEAAKSTPAGAFDLGMAKELLQFYMQASGLGSSPE